MKKVTREIVDEQEYTNVYICPLEFEKIVTNFKKSGLEPFPQMMDW